MYHEIGFVDTKPLASIVGEILFKVNSGYHITPLTEPQERHARQCLGGIVPVDGWISARLIAIKPGGIIHLHTDPLPDGFPRHTRYHVVLTTNPYCWGYHDGSVQRLEAGGVYTIDESLEHASVNWGKTPRVHLVIDAT